MDRGEAAQGGFRGARGEATWAGHVGAASSLSVSVIIPAYNEARNLATVVEEAVRFLRRNAAVFELIIVDDGSSDGTLAVSEQLSRAFHEVRVIAHPRNLGYGASLRDGFAASRYDWIFFTDADHQFRIDHLSGLLALREQADLIVGFRLQRQDPLLRRILALAYNGLIRLGFGVKVKDVDCAFKLFRRVVVESVSIESRRFFVNAELLIKARARGFRILETGVEHFRREYGRSTVRVRDVVRTLVEMIRMWRRVRTGWL